MRFAVLFYYCSMWFKNDIRGSSHPAVIDAQKVLSFIELDSASGRLACLISSRIQSSGARIGIYIHPSVDFAIALLGIWKSGHIAVPLCMSHPEQELRHVVQDAGVLLVISTIQTERSFFGSLAGEINWIMLQDVINIDSVSISMNAEDPALIIYTSGTTSKPKGAVLTHGNLQAQIASLTEAWKWSCDDVILNVLPLHHVHGLINILLCSIANGAVCEFHSRFDPKEVWNWFGKEVAGRKPTLFMAVPTIYSKLIGTWSAATAEVQTEWSAAAAKLRLMVSGSAALPESVLYKWEEITSQRLLERYGMTEIGMALSNPLFGNRKAGFVGKPLPGVDVCLRSEVGTASLPVKEGELFIKGRTVFAGYWNKPESTSAAFTDDGWFRTGDIATVDADGDYKILGRNSQDIIKSGGYKISALEIETALLNHPSVDECAVVGIADEEWGERVSAAVILKGDAITEEMLKVFLQDYLAPYKIPTRWRFNTVLPRNAMGKVVKPELKKLFQG